jgi:hypothetical protein
MLHGIHGLHCGDMDPKNESYRLIYAFSIYKIRNDTIMECFEKIMEILALNAISLISNFIPHTSPPMLCIEKLSNVNLKITPS